MICLGRLHFEVQNVGHGHEQMDKVVSNCIFDDCQSTIDVRFSICYESRAPFSAECWKGFDADGLRTGKKSGKGGPLKG